MDIDDEKVDIDNQKVDIDNILSLKGKDFSVKTRVHIYRLFDQYGFEEVFGRSDVMKVLDLKSSGASKLISNLYQANILMPVSGYGKGKYKFNKT